MPFFYILTVINLPFGIIACLVGISARFGEDGNACAEEDKQPTRAFYLGLQIVCLVIYIPTFMAHIIYFKVRGPAWCHEQFLKFDEEDEEGEDQGE